ACRPGPGSTPSHRQRTAPPPSGKGWTAAQLARASGVEEQLIQRLEDGTVPRIARSHMERLADALGVRPSNVAEFRPSLGLTAIGGTGAGDGAQAGALPDAV
ncbi:MAG TPA: helix-turn-helix transcriptional regulator, partial [Chloroflexota bacterium]|nr:helix-turn-helix transcriptional regulator [Chloroflexota bacterium]